MTFVSADAFGPDYFDNSSCNLELWCLSALRIDKRVDEALLLRDADARALVRLVALLESELDDRGFPLDIEAVVMRDPDGAPVLLVLPRREGAPQ